jgi:hypothetical protein
MILRTLVGHENGTASDEAAVERWVMDFHLGSVCCQEQHPIANAKLLGTAWDDQM